MVLCDFGCLRPAIKQFKSGKYCCSEYTSSCPEMKKKNSNSVSEARRILGTSFWKNGHPKPQLGKIPYNKGKTNIEIFGTDKSKLISEKKKKAAESLLPSWEKMTDDQKEKVRNESSIRIIKRYESGWLPKAGRCEKYTYESVIAGIVKLDGTWELAVAKWLDKNKFNWIRNTKRFPYYDTNNKLRHYTPDFYVEELGGYLEVKGYETELDRCKWLQFKEPLTVWKKEQILSILERGPDGKAADC